MNKTTRYSIVLIPLLLLVFVTGNFFGVNAAEASAAADPYTIYLTWIDDPAATMIIHFHDYASNRKESKLEFRRKGRQQWSVKEGISVHHPYTGDASTTIPPEPLRLIHTVHLTGLRSDTEYEFRFSGSGNIYRFRTMPENLDDTHIRVALRGDLYHIRSEMQNTMRRVAERDPHFVVIGGDWAYADGKEENLWKWDHLWKDWKDAGYHYVMWQADVSSGIYYYTFEATSLENSRKKFTTRNKMVFLK